MRLNPSTSLKWSGFICAALWSGWMMWWIGSFDLLSVVIISMGGLVFGLCWYLAMRFVFGRRPAASGAAADVPRGRLYSWIIWAVLMIVTGIATACLLDLVNPLIPSGDWHWLIGSLFVIVVWPALAWSVRPFLKGHLPA